MLTRLAVLFLLLVPPFATHAMDPEFLGRLPVSWMPDEKLADRFASSTVMRWQEPLRVRFDADRDIPSDLIDCMQGSMVNSMTRLARQTTFQLAVVGPNEAANVVVLLGDGMLPRCREADRPDMHALRLDDMPACASYMISGDAIRSAEIWIGRAIMLEVFRSREEFRRYTSSCATPHFFAMSLFITGYFSASRFRDFDASARLDVGPYHYVMFQLLYAPSIKSGQDQQTIKEEVLRLIKDRRVK